jgi:hypothetical protein
MVAGVARKVIVGLADDRDEPEANRVARDVVNTSNFDLARLSQQTTPARDVTNGAGGCPSGQRKASVAVAVPHDPLERESEAVADRIDGVTERSGVRDPARTLGEGGARPDGATPIVPHAVAPGSVQRQTPPVAAPPSSPAPTVIPKELIDGMVVRIRDTVTSAAIPGTDMALVEAALAELTRMAAEGRTLHGQTGQPCDERPPFGEYDPADDTLTLSKDRFKLGATPGSSQLVTLLHEGFHAARRAALQAIDAALPPIPKVPEDQLTTDQLAHLIEFNLSRYYEEALAHRVDKMVFVAFGVADGVIKPEDAEGRLQTFLANPAEGSSAAAHAAARTARPPLCELDQRDRQRDGFPRGRKALREHGRGPAEAARFHRVAASPTRSVSAAAATMTRVTARLCRSRDRAGWQSSVAQQLAEAPECRDARGHARRSGGSASAV